MKTQNKKKLLLIAPDYYGFHEVIFDALLKYSDHEVFLVISNPTYTYKHAGERILNFFMKIFLKKNLKNIKKEKKLQKKLESFVNIDVLIVNRPDVLTVKNLQRVTEKSKKSVVIYWDSFAKIPTQEKTLKYFDIAFSFDQDDCDRFGLIKNDNFYFIEENIKEIEHDVFFIGTYDQRFKDLIKIFNYFNKNFKQLKTRAQIYSYHHVETPKSLEENIHITNTIIPFKDAYVYNQHTKVILDLAHHHQKGLSFRPFEAMGLKKKLITNNINIKECDFFNPKNILVVDPNNLDISEDFFESSYEELPQEIVQKYSIENWVNNILEKVYGEKV